MEFARLDVSSLLFAWNKISSYIPLCIQIS